MAFSGNTGDETRDKVQTKLATSIGNDGTRPRSIELAIRTEAALWERGGKRASKPYRAAFRRMVKKLKDEREGFDLNRRLLTGELAPEKWAADEVPEVQVERVSSSSSSSSEAKPKPAAAPAPAPAPKKKEPSSSSSSASSSSSGAAGSAADASAYYHFKSTPAEEAKKYAPKKVEAAAAAPKKPVAAGVSSWNSAGTWEERNLSKWACSRLAEVLREADLRAPSYDGGEAAVTASSWSVSGDASMVYVRGKKRYGYELKVKATYKGTHCGEEASGKIDIPSLDVVEGDDFDINFASDKKTDAGAAVRRAVKKLEPRLRKLVAEWVAELKQQ